MRPCEACSNPNANDTNGWYRIGKVRLCKRCEDESMSKTSQYEVRLNWSDDELSYTVVRILRKQTDET
jgi:hypothetical protein